MLFHQIYCWYTFSLTNLSSEILPLSYLGARHFHLQVFSFLHQHRYLCRVAVAAKIVFERGSVVHEVQGQFVFSYSLFIQL